MIMDFATNVVHKDQFIHSFQRMFQICIEVATLKLKEDHSGLNKQVCKIFQTAFKNQGVQN